MVALWQSSITRRGFLRVSGSAGLVVAGSSMLSACSGSASTASGTGSSTMIVDTSGAGKAWTGGVKTFNATQKNVRVNLQTVNFSELLQKQVLLGFSKSSQFDLYPVNGEWTAALAGNLLPLDDYIAKAGLDPTALYGSDATYVSGGNTMGLPGRRAANLWAYRKDLYLQHGFSPPTTIEEWASQSKALTQRDSSGNVTVYGTSFRADSPHWSAVTLAYIYLPYGLRFLTPDLKSPDPSLKSDTAIHLLEVMQEMARSGSTPNPVSFSYQDNITAWQQGKMATSNIYGARSQPIEDKKLSKVIGKVGYAPAPRQSAGPYKPTYFSGPWYLTINKLSAKPDLAWKVVEYLAASKVGQEVMATKYSNQPSLLSVAGGAAYAAIDPAATVSAEVYRKYGGMSMAPVKQNGVIETKLHAEVQALFSGHKTPSAVAAASYEAIAEALKSS